MKYALFLILYVSLFSCATAKWKSAYLFKHHQSLMEKYGADSSLVFSMSSNPGIKKIKDMSRKEIKAYGRRLTHGTAMFPDSIKVSPGRIDSFYTNPNKLEYIRRHKIVSPNIHFF
jgi:hypothetical protein